MNTNIAIGKKSRKLMWYGWQKQAAKHFDETTPRTIEHWRTGKNRSTGSEIKRRKLIDWCISQLEYAGKTPEEIKFKINEAFGEC